MWRLGRATGGQVGKLGRGTGPLGAALQLGGKGQRGLAERHRPQRRGQRTALAAPFGRLDRIPVALDVFRAGHVHITEHVRVPAGQLLHDPRGHVVDVETGAVGAFGRDAGVKHDLEQDIAEFVAQRRLIAALQRLQRFVTFFQQVGGERLVRLPGIPGAVHPQGVHDLDQPQEGSTRRPAAR